MEYPSACVQAERLEKRWRAAASISGKGKEIGAVWMCIKLRMAVICIVFVFGIL